MTSIGPELEGCDMRLRATSNHSELKLGLFSKANIGRSSNLLEGCVMVDPTTPINCKVLNVENGNSTSPILIKLNVPATLVNGKEIVEPTILSSHFNLTFGGSMESTMKINRSILDPSMHSTVSFKENVIPNSPKVGLLEVTQFIKDEAREEKVLLSVTTIVLVKLFEIAEVGLKILAMQDSFYQAQRIPWSSSYAPKLRIKLRHCIMLIIVERNPTYLSIKGQI